MDATTITLLLKAPQHAKAVAVMLGIIESVDQKIDKLLSSDFNAGIRHLEELQLARKSHAFLLKQAWTRFDVALTHEKGERKALAYLALGFCQYRLGEKEIALRSLEELTVYEYIDKQARYMKHATLFAHTLPSALSFIPAVGSIFFVGRTLNPNAQLAFVEFMRSIPSEERVRVLKEQVKQFLEDERG